jgi:3-oxoacyl-[acyl-carrier protein] reductase
MNDTIFNFTGRTVIVTGAGRGIGLAISTGFRAAGADVWMIDLDDDVVSAAANGIGGHPITGDVSSSSDVERAVAQVVSTGGRVDVLVNNAGVLRDGMVWKLSDSDWDTVLAVHLGGAFRCTRACVPQFRLQGSGRIVNVTSYAGVHGNVGQANYSAAKAGIIGFTKAAAKELAHFGVTVNAVLPNAQTRMIDSIPDEKLDQLRALIPLRRFGDPSEIWPAVGFLASEEAGYITGTILSVDGGISM